MQANTLVEKIRRSREQRVIAGNHTFIIRRPTDIEMLEFARDRRPIALLRFVVGWEKVTEGDIIPGGDPHPALFDLDACVEWLSDRMDLFGPVTDAIIASYESHRRKQDEAAKN